MQCVFILLNLSLICTGFAHANTNTDDSPVDPYFDEKVVTLTIGEDWEPYYSQALPKGGVVAELVREAFSRSGYQLKLKWLPWARALASAKDGTFDGVLGAWYSEERTEFFSYTDSFLATEIVFFKKKDNPAMFSSIEALKQFKVGVARSSVPHELLRQKIPDNLDIATNAEMNIQKLMAGRFDLLADEKLNVLNIVNSRFPEWLDSIEILEPSLQVNELFVIISRQQENHQEIVRAFNAGLKQIIEDGTYQAILIEFHFGGNDG